MPDFRPADSFRSPRFAQPATFMRYDHAGITSLLAANLLFEIISVIAATRLHQREDSGVRNGKA